MATSGSIDYSLNAREICTYALKKLRVIGAGETPSSEDMADALEELNVMLKGWSVTGPNLWRQTFGAVTITNATASYTLSPRPVRVIECRYRNASGIDLPMVELTRQKYVDLPQKSSSGTPTQYFVDYQRAVTTLYVWPVLATASGETFQYTYQRSFEDLDALTNDLDIPQEHLDVVGYNLADRLQDQFGKDIPRVTQRAMMLRQQASDFDRDPYVTFEPDFSY